MVGLTHFDGILNERIVLQCARLQLAIRLHSDEIRLKQVSCLGRLFLESRVVYFTINFVHVDS